jgi:hypothetical protein
MKFSIKIQKKKQNRDLLIVLKGRRSGRQEVRRSGSQEVRRSGS